MKKGGIVQEGFREMISNLTGEGGKFLKYRDDPIGYARDVLGVKYLSAIQEEFLSLLAQPHSDDWHGKVAIGTGVNVGKSYALGIAVNWFYDCRGPCIVTTTAPSQMSVVDLLWKEVRLHRSNAPIEYGMGTNDFIGPAAPEMRRAPNWLAKGLVAAKGETFKGRHVERMMFIMDEAVGLPEMYFRATKTMFKPDGHMIWICAYNPTDTSSVMYQEVMAMDSTWRVLEFSSLGHPNVIASLAGLPLPIPAAVSVSQLEAAIKDDCEEILPEEKRETDFEWQPGSGRWYRPGPAFESEYMGRWPSQDEAALWTDALWNVASQRITWADVKVGADEIPRLGCDVARKGNNKTAIAVVLGDYLVNLETRQGQNTMITTGRLIELANEWAEKVNVARTEAGLKLISGYQVPIKIDDDGIGGSACDRLKEQGYNVIPINAQSRPARPKRYPDKRSEIWFELRDRARKGAAKFGLLQKRMLDYLKLQAKAPMTDVNSQGQRFVEPKQAMMDRLDGQSPDGMDAVNLAYYSIDFRTAEPIDVEYTTVQQRFAKEQASREIEYNRHQNYRALPRRRLFGQGR